MQTSIGIIGMGWVGSSVAISVLQRGICQELLLHDLRPGLAEGEAMDLNHGSSFYPTAMVKAARIEDMMKCAAIVITAGRGGKPGESRLDLLKENIQIAKLISTALKGFSGMLIVVSNPVDVLTYYYQKFTELPVSKVIGTGTMLDTSRLRERIGRELNLDPRSVHAHVVGEHGDSEVVLWSNAHVGLEPLRSWKSWDGDKEEEIAKEVRTSAYEIIKRKGATNHAIGLVTAALLKWILRGERRIITLSTCLNGPYGLQDLATSLPCIVGEEGVEEVLEIEMQSSEKADFLRSCEVLRSAIESVS